MSTALVAFVGPSLDPAEAAVLCKGTVLPPAAQGDIWRALSLKPKGIVLIDGVFESRPSVWHREIKSALSSGVAVFGASSMGALRAAELSGSGMVGIGQVYAWVSEGEIVDDADVALLHADGDHGFRPLTVPLVNVRVALEQAQREGVLRPLEARALFDAAQAMFYQERTWPRLRDLMRRRWSTKTLSAWDAFVQRGLPDIKQEDARACLRAAREFVDSRVQIPSSPVLSARPSSAVRRRRIRDGVSREGSSWALSLGVLERLRQRRDVDELLRHGLIRSVLASVARAQGLTVSEEEREATWRAWMARVGPGEDRSTLLAAMGMDADEAGRLVEDVALQEALLAHARRVIPDAPSEDELLAQEARWRGVWKTALKART